MAQHLVFDASDAQSILDSSNVGAFVRAADGTLITKTTYGAVQALDVSISNASIVVADGGGSLTVDAVNLDIRDLVAATDSVSSWTKDGSGTAITSTAGALDVNIKTPLVLDVKLDGVYTLSNLLADSVGNIFNSRAVTPDISGQVERATVALLGTVASADVSKIHALDVNAFLSAKNSVSGDLSQLTIDNVSGGLNVNVANSITVSDSALANVAIKQKAEVLAVANTAQAVFSAPLAARKYAKVFCFGNKAAFIGDATVTEANGYPIYPGSEIDLRVGSAVVVDFVGQTGVSGAVSAQIRTLQLS
jgi:hypothetical protein